MRYPKKYQFGQGKFNRGKFSNKLGNLIGMGLTFYKDFRNCISLMADFSIGSATATYTSTSGIPTLDANGYAVTTANVDLLKYATSGNRTAAQETIVIKFTPNSDFANDGIIRALTNTGTPPTSNSDQVLRKSSTGTVIYHAPESSSGYSGSTTILGSVSYVVAGVCYGISENINARIYLNGNVDGSQSSDYLLPNYGSHFSIGCYISGVNQLNGSIAWIKIFNRALTASEIATLQ